MTDVLHTIHIYFYDIAAGKKKSALSRGYIALLFLLVYVRRKVLLNAKRTTSHTFFKRIVNVWHILDEGFLSEECYFIGLSSVNYYYRFFFYIAERPAVGVYILLHCCDGEIFRFLKWCRRCRAAPLIHLQFRCHYIWVSFEMIYDTTYFNCFVCWFRMCSNDMLDESRDFTLHLYIRFKNVIFFVLFFL